MNRLFSISLLLLFSGHLAAHAQANEATAHAQAPDGAALYSKNCASCHENMATHAPPLSQIRQMSPEDVLRVMTTGSMQPMAALLTAEEKRAVARYVAAKDFGGVQETEPTSTCAKPPAEFVNPLDRPNWNGWSAGVTNARYQPAPGLSAADVPKLKLRWAFGISGAKVSYGQPSVVNGHVFLGTAAAAVYSLDAKTGCTDWIFRSAAGVRTGITIAKPSQLARYAAFFGDGLANMYAVDATTGKLLWKLNLESFPSSRITGTPVYYGDRLYVPISITEEGLAINPKYECCRARPSIVALEAATGKIIWRHYNVEAEAKQLGKSPNGTQLWGPSGVSVWSSPTLDPEKKALYFGTGNNFSNPPTNNSDAIMALSMETGAFLWARQVTEDDVYNVACVSLDRSNCPKDNGPDADFGSSPMLIKLPNGKRALVAGQKSGVVTAVDPDDQGKVLWQSRIGKGGLIGGIEWGTATDGKLIYAALSDMAWTGMNILDPDKGGGIFALDVTTGKREWYTPPPGCKERTNCSPAQSSAVSALPGAVFSGSEDGHIRAYSSKDGKIIWDFNTARDYTTVNQIAAKGGSIDGPGPAIVDGVVYVPSGYGFWGGHPGNVLLAFSVDGK